MIRLSDYLTVVEAAKVLGVSKDTLRRWDKKGKLTARRHPVTRYRLYLKKELEDLLRLLGAGSAKRNKAARTRGR
jgi:excisionase family DNA binding protein